MSRSIPDNNGALPGPRRERTGHHDGSMRSSAGGTGAKCDRLCDTPSERRSNVWSRQSTEKSSEKQSLTSRQPAPNSSFLWNKSNRVSSEQSSSPEEEVYDDVQNCHTYSEIVKHDDVRRVSVSRSTDNLTQSKRTSQIYLSGMMMMMIVMMMMMMMV